MTRERHPDTPYGIPDLMRVTGLGRDACKNAVNAGELPGYKVGSRYTVPAEAFRSLCAGTWKPQPREIVITTQPTVLHSIPGRKVAS